MITIEKTYGVKGVANDATMLRLQELIFLAKKQYGLVGKAVIDTEKITPFVNKWSCCYREWHHKI